VPCHLLVVDKSYCNLYLEQESSEYEVENEQRVQFLHVGTEILLKRIDKSVFFSHSLFPNAVT
jgi:hypothetical protein